MTKHDCLTCRHEESLIIKSPCHDCDPNTFDHWESKADAPAPTMTDEQVVERFNGLLPTVTKGDDD